MSATIRQAAGRDAAQLAELAAVTFPLACPPGSNPDDIALYLEANLGQASFEQYLADPLRTIFVAEHDGALLAYTLLVSLPPSDADVAALLTGLPAVELSKCYAHPDHHGAGLAGRIMAASADCAFGQGAASLWLGVNNENARAVKFYGKHGFGIVGTKTFTLGTLVEEDFVMVRPAP
jgi:diamine N-acetyltransferase